jgi:hypothetical protein
LEISIDDQLNTAPKMDEMIDFDGISDEDMEIAQNNFNSYKAVVEVRIMKTSLILANF